MEISRLLDHILYLDSRFELSTIVVVFLNNKTKQKQRKRKKKRCVVSCLIEYK